MSVIIETNYGDFTIDLYYKKAEKQCFSFLISCFLKKLNNIIIKFIQKDFLCIFGDSPSNCLVPPEVIEKSLKHRKKGLIGARGFFNDPLTSFYFTLSDELDYLNNSGFIFGEIVEGMDVLDKINNAITNQQDVPLQHIRILHTTIIFNPFKSQCEFDAQSLPESPQPIVDVEFKVIRTKQEALRIVEETSKAEAASRAAILEMFNDMPDSSLKPPENILFVCKLNPCTQSDELQLIFSKYGDIKNCEIVRDWKTGDSLQYAFVEFTDVKNANNAWAKLQGCIIDDRRIHVDFSQSVAKHYLAYRTHGAFGSQSMKINREEDINFNQSISRNPSRSNQSNYDSENRKDFIDKKRSSYTPRYNPNEKVNRDTNSRGRGEGDLNYEGKSRHERYFDDYEHYADRKSSSNFRSDDYYYDTRDKYTHDRRRHDSYEESRSSGGRGEEEERRWRDVSNSDRNRRERDREWNRSDKYGDRERYSDREYHERHRSPYDKRR